MREDVRLEEQQPEPAGAVVNGHEQIAGLLCPQSPTGCGVTPSTWTPAGGDLDHEQHVQPLQEHGVHGEEVHASTPLAWARRNCRQVRADRLGAGSTPARCRMAQTVLAPIL